MSQTAPRELTPRVLKTQHGQYILSEWDGTNQSGIVPLCDKVVVKVDASMSTTKGGILLPDDQQDRMSLASTTGIMVAVGPQAFGWDTDRTVKWEGLKPEPGVRVCFQKYSGQEYTGLDGELYRVMQDRSIAGVMEGRD